MKKEEIFEYVQKQYGTIPEYLWSKLPDSAVLRHKNGKWYAVIMTVETSKLGLEGKEPVDIMDVKCDPDMTNMIIQTYGFLPGYHMNKQHWITILLYFHDVQMHIRSLFSFVFLSACSINQVITHIQKVQYLCFTDRTIQ